MGSFVAWAMLGLFPVPGQAVYLVTAPFFAAVAVTSPATKATATLRCENFDGGRRNVFVQRATRDGAPWPKSWVGHDFFAAGGELVLVLGDTESAWGSRAEDRPPSLSPP